VPSAGSDGLRGAGAIVWLSRESTQSDTADQTDLSEKIAVVTGGGRFPGREIALTLTRVGASVAVTARSADQFRATADETHRTDLDPLRLR
jgi:hypothetical protein